MKYLLTLTITSLFSLYCLYIAVTNYFESYKYEMYYKAFQSEHEAFRRTIGRPVNTMYTCKKK
jgi:hypothetical protein